MQHCCWLPCTLGKPWWCILPISNLWMLCSCSLGVADKLLRASLILLKQLHSLLHNTSQNSSASTMSSSNLTICVAPNLLSPAEDNLLLQEALMEFPDKVSWIYQVAIALRAHQTFPFQRYLAEQISLEQILVEVLPGRAATLLQLSVVVARLMNRKGRWIYFQPHSLKAMVLCVQVDVLMECFFFVENCRQILGRRWQLFQTFCWEVTSTRQPHRYEDGLRTVTGWGFWLYS